MSIKLEPVEFVTQQATNVQKDFENDTLGSFSCQIWDVIEIKEEPSVDFTLELPNYEESKKITLIENKESEREVKTTKKDNLNKISNISTASKGKDKFVAKSETTVDVKVSKSSQEDKESRKVADDGSKIDLRKKITNIFRKPINVKLEIKTGPETSSDSLMQFNNHQKIVREPLKDVEPSKKIMKMPKPSCTIKTKTESSACVNQNDIFQDAQGSLKYQSTTPSKIDKEKITGIFRKSLNVELEAKNGPETSNEKPLQVDENLESLKDIESSMKVTNMPNSACIIQTKTVSSTCPDDNESKFTLNFDSKTFQHPPVPVKSQSTTPYKIDDKMNITKIICKSLNAKFETRKSLETTIDRSKHSHDTQKNLTEPLKDDAQGSLKYQSTTPSKIDKEKITEIFRKSLNVELEAKSGPELSNDKPMQVDDNLESLKDIESSMKVMNMPNSACIIQTKTVSSTCPDDNESKFTLNFDSKTFQKAQVPVKSQSTTLSNIDTKMNVTKIFCKPLNAKLEKKNGPETSVHMTDQCHDNQKNVTEPLRDDASVSLKYQSTPPPKIDKEKITGIFCKSLNVELEAKSGPETSNEKPLQVDDNLESLKDVESSMKVMNMPKSACIVQTETDFSACPDDNESKLMLNFESKIFQKAQVPIKSQSTTLSNIYNKMNITKIFCNPLNAKHEKKNGPVTSIHMTDQCHDNQKNLTEPLSDDAQGSLKYQSSTPYKIDKEKITEIFRKSLKVKLEAKSGPETSNNKPLQVDDNLESLKDVESSMKVMEMAKPSCTIKTKTESSACPNDNESHLTLGFDSKIFQKAQVPVKLQASSECYKKDSQKATVFSINCMICCKSFGTKSSLYNHSRTHQPKVECQICHRMIQKYLFQQHIKCHSEYKPYSCDLCSKTFNNIKSVRKHMYQHMSIKRFHCEVCGRGYNDNRHLKEHRLGHTHPDAYRCDFCPKGYERKQSLQVHMEGCHMEESKVYECNICGFKTKLRIALFGHSKRHNKTVPCSVCGRNFANRSEMRDHESAVHIKEKKYDCKICGKMFVNQRYVSKHMRRTHVDSKKFKCEKCESTFKSKDILRQHNKKHETEVVECSICKRTVKSCYLRKHQRVNTVCKEISLKNEK